MRKAFVLFLAAIFFALTVASLPTPAVAQSTGGTTSNGYKYLAASLAFGVAAAGAGYALGQSGAAAIAAVVEKPEIRTSALVFVALAEAIAIYGFVIAIIILGQTG